MSPPEVWGPPVWTFFHVLAEKVNENAYPIIKNQMFIIIQKICGFLPCPECAKDAAGFLGKVRINDLRNKTDFKNMLFFFHNYVNSKKRKRIYNYSDLEVYKRYNIIYAFNNFIRVYHTKGNMKQLSESFQRQFVIKDVRKWVTRNIRAFIFTTPNNSLTPGTQITEVPIITLVSEEPVTLITLDIEELVTLTTLVSEEELVPKSEELVPKSEELVPKREEPVTLVTLVSEEEPVTLVTLVSEEEPTFDKFYLDKEYVSQNIFESKSHLFKDNLPDENFNDGLNIERIYTDSTEIVIDDLLDDLLINVAPDENITEEPNKDLNIDLSVDIVVVKKKSKKRKNK
jgi:hypothetical protein